MGETDPSIQIAEHNGQTIFNISVTDAAQLIGYRGETLRALNHLVKRIAEEKKETPSEVPSGIAFSIDVNGYNQKRIAVLEAEAKALAERAKMFKHEIEMSPMNPYERMIVHEALRDTPNVTTESSGEGKFRHVVIRYQQ